MAWGKRNRHAAGYGRAWERIRAVALRRDQGLCQPCRRAGRPTPATEVDHVTPKAEGGTDELGNLQSICRECHADKTAREAARAQGRRPRRRIRFDAAGWPVWPEGEGGVDP